MSTDAARAAASVLLCEHCGHAVERSHLVAGPDGVCEVEADPATAD